jgi:threonine dehydrogenase-like Zn-dependent dehydrogenase
VLLQMKASSICGSDIRAIYREHLGSGPEAYRDVIAGHEPCGQVVAVGPGTRRLSVGTGLWCITLPAAVSARSAATAT